MTGTSTPAKTIPREANIPDGTWYGWVVFLSTGLLAFWPLLHAYQNTKRTLYLREAQALGVFTVLLIIPTIPNPPTGSFGDVWLFLHLVLLIVGMFIASRARKEVYAEGMALYKAQQIARAQLLIEAGKNAALAQSGDGYGVSPQAFSPPAPAPRAPAVDPHLARALELRTKRGEARELAATDPVLARSLGVGDRSVQGYEDGGLLDLNTASAHECAELLHMSADDAELVLARRERFNGFGTLEEVELCSPLSASQLDLLHEYGVLLPYLGEASAHEV